jgi:hypothetical protein
MASLDSTSNENSSAITFGNSLPTYEKEDTFSNTLPTYTKEETFSNTLPTPDREDTFSNTLPTSTNPKEDPTATHCGSLSEQRIIRRVLFSHISSLILAIPTLVLLSIDLHAYHNRPPTNSYVEPGQYSTVNPILILDVLGVVLLILTIFSAATFLSFRAQITPATIRTHVVVLFCIDAILCVGIQAIGDTVISMRSSSGQTSCVRFMHLDPNACDSWRRTITRAAGAIAIVTR